MKYNFTVEIDKEADITKLMYLWQNFSLLKYFFATNAYFSYTHIQLIEKFILTMVVCYNIIHSKSAIP